MTLGSIANSGALTRMGSFGNAFTWNERWIRQSRCGYVTVSLRKRANVEIAHSSAEHKDLWNEHGFEPNEMKKRANGTRDRRRKTKALFNEINHPGADTIRVDLKTGLIFAEIAADQTRPVEVRARNRDNALNAYRTMLKFRDKLELT